MQTKLNSNFFLSALASTVLLLCLVGISTTKTFAQSPIFVSGNPTCADINADNTNFPSITSNNGFSTNDAPNKNPQTYTIQNVGTVTVNYNSDTNITFSASSAFVTAVVVKAGDGANVYVYNPATASGGPLITPLNDGGNRAGLSHLVFCYEVSVRPTAAAAMIAGRVTVNNSMLRGTGNLLVSILNTNTLETQYVFTNRLGYYQFDNLQVGDTYVIAVRAKGYSFTPQTFTLVEDSVMDMFGTTVSKRTRL